MSLSVTRLPEPVRHPAGWVANGRVIPQRAAMVTVEPTEP